MKALVALVLCGGLLGGAAVQAQTYRVGVELQGYPPFYSIQGEQYQGYARDLLDAFATSQGHRFVYVALPLKRLLNDFLAGKLDFKYPDRPQWSTEQKRGHLLYYSAATVAYTDAVLVPPARLGQGKARIRVLGTLRGFTPGPYLEDIQSRRMGLIETNSIDSLLKMALAGRVDAAFVNPLVARHALVAAGLPADSLVPDPSLAAVEDYYYLSSQKHPQVIAAFDAFLRSHPEQLQRLRHRYAIE
ncbi:substrate-binding periplasmic protein [Pseudomonas zhanjiangensis]|uniref:Substrate-binding periplasmic protein n=1 Tax=Pseudomonas zhanjiangensis TaxID=3239015 RepID=A0ABV3YPC0_9PSED